MMAQKIKKLWINPFLVSQPSASWATYMTQEEIHDTIDH